MARQLSRHDKEFVKTPWGPFVGPAALTDSNVKMVIPTTMSTLCKSQTCLGRVPAAVVHNHLFIEFESDTKQNSC